MRAMTLATFACAGIALSCSPYRVTHNPAPPLQVPDGYRGGAAGQAASSSTPGGAPAALPEKWWTDFDDATLDQLVERSLRDNFQLRAAWARVEQARAIVAQANSGKFPQLELNASASRQKLRFNFQQEITVQSNQFSASVGAGYELDLWRRIGNGADGAELDALALHDDVQAIAITLAAEVSEAWFDIIAQKAQRKLIEEQLATNETYLELVRLRFEKGLASALDVYQQRQQLVATRSQLTLIDSAITLFEHRLAVLLGAAPGQVAPASASADTLPGMPPVPAAGLPADLLERRPDVRAARRRVEAADYRVAVAVADRLPGLRLSGSTSLQSASLVDFIASPLWSIIASVAAPLFDGGRRKAEVARQQAVVQERLMSYGQTMLQAMAEVENALVQERQQLLYIAELERGLELSSATLREAQARYRQGLIDYLPVLAALQNEQRAQVNLLVARRQLLSYRVQLCRALGGSWTRTLEPRTDEPGTDEPATDEPGTDPARKPALATPATDEQARSAL